MSNHVLLKSELTGSFNGDRLKIFRVLKNGNFYMAIDMLGDPKGFVATVEDDGKSHMMGSEIRFSKNMEIESVFTNETKRFF